MSNTNQILRTALDIGEGMLINGAEIGRVEDSVERILRAYGARRADVFSITNCIIANVDWGDEGSIAQTRRIRLTGSNMHKLSALNALSRDICLTTPEICDVEVSLREIDALPVYSNVMQCIIYALVAGSFSLFFGGSYWDAIAAAVIGIGIKQLMNALWRLSMNRILSGAMCSMAGGIATVLALRLGIPANFDKVAIGVIMLLIPGVLLTNALRDMLSGDTLSGVMRLVDAMLIAISVALGFALAGGLL